MRNVVVKYNEQEYIATYNDQTKCYEIELETPSNGGIYDTNIKYTAIDESIVDENKIVQILEKDKIKIEMNKVFLYIFNQHNFSIKDIIELADYEINIDEETNSNSIIKILTKTTAKAKDIIFIKKNNEMCYTGIIDKIQNENGNLLYEINAKYVTNMFNQDVELKDEHIIRSIGVEDHIAKTINDNFVNNEDTFLNKQYLKVIAKTHTAVERTVDNVQNGIYNLHTWMTNCTQNYNITYNFTIEEKGLVLTIEKEDIKKALIDINAQNIFDYTEVFETNVVSKVKVLTKEEGSYTLYLKTDRTTTEDMLDENRAVGETKIVYTEKMADAKQTAEDTIKQNSYKHMISFNMIDQFMKVGTPIAVKTKESVILDTYISAIKITKSKATDYVCGNMRINFIDNLLKERKK